MERTAAATGLPSPDPRGLLDGIPCQPAPARPAPPPTGPPPATWTAEPPLPPPLPAEPLPAEPLPAEPPPAEPLSAGPGGAVSEAGAPAVPSAGGVRRRRRRVPAPFTLAYTAVLAVTSYVTAHAAPALVHALHQGSSTDVAHLVRAPVLVLSASALWVAGGFASPFTLGFVVVLTALERRVGGARTAVVFLLGHVLATLATEVPVGLAVLAGGLPGSSLHRLDYGISFGVAASVGALAGLLRPWLRLPLLVGFGAMLLQDLIAYTDPLTNWGHLIALAIGVATWPRLRTWERAHRLAAG
ncbi:rhomboid-like protein [Streptomyces asoensis]|uniref:rhomboid-like protein n=1 Tax=Streptomyces asoensis TaxID=249586 RepID=UPI0033CE4E6E